VHEFHSIGTVTQEMNVNRLLSDREIMINSIFHIISWFDLNSINIFEVDSPDELTITHLGENYGSFSQAISG
jgi:hypothetical protein